jgi:hypothetical protein
MTVLYSWDASVPGIDAGGVTHTEDAAKTAVVTWMRAHGANYAVMERVRLTSSTRLILCYHPTGYRLVAQRRKNNRIVWTRVRTRETELAAS